MTSNKKRLTICTAIPLTILLLAIAHLRTAADDVSSATIETPGLVAERPADRRFVETDRGYMVAYTEQIPGTEVTFTMIPIPGGTFLMGSPETEAGRSEDEGPQVRVRVPPMWVGRCEVTWAEYHVFMGLYEPFKQLSDLRFRLQSGSEESRTIVEKISDLEALEAYLQLPADVDAVTCPTPLYEPTFTYEPGEDPDQPAVTMSQFGAKQYTKWLSGITGRQFRLPTEAEWEYAARAGSTTAYSFGDSPDNLGEFAWFAANADDQHHAVGSKQPNAWGLYDMHGNAAEWVLDEYAAGHYGTLPPENVTTQTAVNWPTVLFPRVIRGGCWFDDPEMCRSAARHQSADEDWTLSDPNLPISPWWLTEYESTGVGMRIVRPLEPMDEQMKKRVWEADVESIRLDVEDRLAEGRGTQAPATALLPAALGQLEAARDALENAPEE